MMRHELGASTSHDEQLTDPLSVAAHAAYANETTLVMDTLKKAGKTNGNASCNKAEFGQTLSIEKRFLTPFPFDCPCCPRRQALERGNTALVKSCWR